MSILCPLCQSRFIEAYAKDKRRHFLQCTQCTLVFADPSSWPNNSTEKAEYDLHENALDNAGYNRFLSRMVKPLCDRIESNSQILDFGCGPAPALANQLTDLGHTVALYDVFYAANPQVFSLRFDAIVLTEVIEHLHQPRKDLLRLWQCLKPGGVLAVMTQRVIDQTRFQQWNYKNDPTHVCFYSETSFEWLASHFRAAKLEYEGRDMVFLTKGIEDPLAK